MQQSSKNEIIFIVDEASDLPIWAQLRNRIAYLIRTRYFAPGEQIPSVRSLSAAARINYNTVTKAYKDLESSGLIVSIRGRGMYVQKDLGDDPDSEDQAIDIVIEDCIQQYRTSGMTFEDIRQRMTSITDRIEQDSNNATKEKMGYYDAE